MTRSNRWPDRGQSVKEAIQVAEDVLLEAGIEFLHCIRRHVDVWPLEDLDRYLSVDIDQRTLTIVAEPDMRWTLQQLYTVLCDRLVHDNPLTYQIATANNAAYVAYRMDNRWSLVGEEHIVDRGLMTAVEQRLQWFVRDLEEFEEKFEEGSANGTDQ